MLGCVIGWWLLVSALLFVTWNKVIVMLAGLKKVRYWHALLVVATLCAFCLPHHYKKHHSWRYAGMSESHGCGGACQHSGQNAEGAMEEGASSCPHH